MNARSAMVLTDRDTLACVCPYHGAQPEADYRAGVAPCGCLWQFDKHSVLRALRADSVTFSSEAPAVNGSEHGNEKC